MTLIDRLRENWGDNLGKGGCQGCYSNTMDEAADEIERLRAALIEAREALDTCDRSDGSSGLEVIRQGRPIKTWIDDALLRV